MLLAMGSVPAAHAFQFTFDNSDLRLSWDNTIKYSAAMRLEGRQDRLVDSRNPNNLNQDDGDRNFDQGLISNRVDLFSELEFAYKDFGVRASGSAWYDTMYNSKNDNNSPATANARSVGHDEFTDETRDLHGRSAELLDAFAYGKFNAGPTTTSFRGGQYALQWGESLFFGNNGIAGGMAPVDAVKALSVPNSKFNEIIRPVPQASAQVQIGSKIAFGGYYQFRWERTILPAVGSYFSQSDAIDEGGERLFVGGPIVTLHPGGPPSVGQAPEAWFRGDDEEAKDSGQWGVQLHVRPTPEFDLGFYALNYHSKTGLLYARMYKVPGTPLGLPPPPAGPPVFNPGAINTATGKSGEYYMVFPENIQAYGVSASTALGDNFSLGAEVSMRRHAPLASDLQAHPYNPNVPAFSKEPDNNEDNAYATGNTLHAQLSWLASFGPSFLSNESSFLGEIAWNRCQNVTDNEDAIDPNATRDAWGIRTLFTPTYRQVAPGLDLSVPVGVAYFPKGASQAVGGFGPDKGGTISLGLTAAYLDAWRFALNYTHFYGPAQPNQEADKYVSFKQVFADRDFLSFSVYRTF
jgi:hypothetical protein